MDGEQSTVVYRLPANAPVVDGFRPSPLPWLAGNRGVDFATVVGDPVTAAADGEVLFAGAVGGDLHVTVGHADGLRTSYSFLGSVAVTAGEQVSAGATIGTAAGMFHFGVRDPLGVYLDPLALFSRPVARLVPGGDDGAAPPPPGPPAAGWPGGGGVATVPVAGWALGGWDLLTRGLMVAGAPVAVVPDLARVGPALAHYAAEFPGLGAARSTLADLAAVAGDQGPCTDGGVPVPPPAGRRIMVLVAGFASTSGTTGIDAVDHATLGYEGSDVVRFSYRGGRTPPAAGDTSPLANLPSAPYDAGESLGDLEGAGDDLARLLAGIAAAEPGVPIDVVAHSQGGVVARVGVANAHQRGELPAEVANLVTLGSPHQGADLATAGSALAGTPRGAAVLNLAGSLGLGISAESPALHQLGERSALSGSPGGGTNGAGLPPGVGFRSIAARGDLVVPAPRSGAPGAVSATVSLTGPGAHNDLPGSAGATREIGLAVAGLPPGCRSRPDRLADAVVGRGVGAAQDAAGASLLAAALVL